MASTERGLSMPLGRIGRQSPDRWTALDFWWRSRALIALRILRDTWQGRPRRWPSHQRSPLADAPVLACDRSPLWTDGRPDEFVLGAGKVHSLRGQRSSSPDKYPLRSSMVLPLIGSPPPVTRGDLSGEQARCFRHQPASASQQARTAVLLDAYTPELARHVLARHANADRFVPMPFRLSPWAPHPTGWAHEDAAYRASWPAVRRAVLQRLAARQGNGRRQAAIVEGRRQLAQAYAARLSPLHTHLVVDLGLLPHLQALGVLAGRTIEVLAAELPMSMVQAQLDLAASAHPQEPQLRDFRVDAALLSAERQALEAAQSLVTPHAYLATQAGQWTAARIERLAWYGEPRSRVETAVVEPFKRGFDDRPLIVFPASVLARKGALELSAALHGLPCRLRVLGSRATDPDFWREVSLEPCLPDADPLDGADLVVLPAHVDHSPRLLLRALTLGLPVIATPQCGLGDMPGLALVPAGDVQALRLALQRVLALLHA